MPDRRLRIERLVVRVRGVPASHAREVAVGLGESVLCRLEPLIATASQSAHLDQVRAGNVSIEPRACASSTRESAAAAIAAAIASRLPVDGEG